MIFNSSSDFSCWYDLCFCSLRCNTAPKLYIIFIMSCFALIWKASCIHCLPVLLDYVGLRLVKVIEWQNMLSLAKSSTIESLVWSTKISFWPHKWRGRLGLMYVFHITSYLPEKQKNSQQLQKIKRQEMLCIKNRFEIN